MPESTPQSADEQAPELVVTDRTEDTDGDFTVTFELRPRQN